MRRAVSLLAVLLALGAPAEARARSAAPEVQARKAGKARRARPADHPCYAKLEAMQVPFERARAHRGIDLPVEITGPVGGVTFRTWHRKPLVLDCSLVYSLAVAGAYFTEAGIGTIFYSSAYQRRNVRGTAKPSRHSYGLAIDLHEFSGADLEKVTVADDYEQGLGDDEDCLGAPFTPAGAVLRLLACRMDRSGLFRLILTPDSDADHWNHFHVEARPWEARTDLPRPPATRRAGTRATRRSSRRASGR